MHLEIESTEFQLFQDTFNVNGIDSQLDQVQEEAMELALAIRKYKRANEEWAFAGVEKIAERKKELISEIADMQIMLAQCKLIFSNAEIEAEITRKLEKHRIWLNKKIKG